MRFTDLMLFASAACASAIPRDASAPQVSYRDGTVIGKSNGKIDTFTAIPYAQPPIGPLRLKPPRPLNGSFGTLTLPDSPNICPQTNLSMINTEGLPPPSVQVAQTFSNPVPGTQSEDCLNLNVQRPANTKPGAKLPVVLWIYGGGNEIGATTQYDASLIIGDSLAAGQPVLYVAMNYRIGAFGLLAGKDLQKDGSTNLALRDQRLAMQWVAENIASFGGDPDRVTIWGESGGAYFVQDHMLVNGGDNAYKGKPLFHGAVMNSGSAQPTAPVDSDIAQNTYDAVVAAAGCSSAADRLKCLRSVSYETFHNAGNSQPNFLGYNGVGRGVPYSVRGDPSSNFFSQSADVAIAQHKFTRVPIISGNQEDEGTIFALATRNLSTTADVIGYLQQQYVKANKAQITSLVNSYPDDPAAGSPFRTGTQNQLYPQFKRVAAILGDLAFTLRRRRSLSQLAPAMPSWSYLATYGYGLPYLGTTHVSDVGEIYYDQPNAKVGAQIRAYYINFFNHLDPNGRGLTSWPRYYPWDLKMLNFSSNGVSETKDDFRQKSYEAINANEAVLVT